MASTEADRAKKIRLYKNGDRNFTGKEFVLNKRKIRTFESFLNTATSGLNSNYPIRSICTPNQGHSVTSLEQLQDNQIYVAVEHGRFKNLG